MPSVTTIKSIKRISAEDRYDISVKKNENFFADGILVHNCRLLTIIDEDGNIKCMSRNGKEFTTLTRLKEEIKEVWPQLRSIVFDGEICIVDENGDEHFDQIIRLVNKKDFTIPFPKYRVFDILSFNEFVEGTSDAKLSTRQARWDIINHDYGQRKTEMIVSLVQARVETRAQLDALFAEANDKNWEGLIIRKDAPYQGKRSNDMLKVKNFLSEELIITSVTNGPFQFVENGREIVRETLASVTVDFHGSAVSVGSGFSKDQRDYWYNHPEELIGKPATIKYFEVTHNQDGGTSLRFPVFLGIRDYE
jgi:DNA ligase-1